MIITCTFAGVIHLQHCSFEDRERHKRRRHTAAESRAGMFEFCHVTLHSGCICASTTHTVMTSHDTPRCLHPVYFDIHASHKQLYLPTPHISLPLPQVVRVVSGSVIADVEFTAPQGTNATTLTALTSAISASPASMLKGSSLASSFMSATVPPYGTSDNGSGLSVPAIGGIAGEEEYVLR